MAKTELEAELQRRRKQHRAVGGETREQFDQGCNDFACVQRQLPGRTLQRTDVPWHLFLGQLSRGCALRLAEPKGCPLQLPPALETVCSTDQRATPVAHPLQPQRKRRRATPLHNNTHGARGRISRHRRSYLSPSSLRILALLPRRPPPSHCDSDSHSHSDNRRPLRRRSPHGS
ncbi:hypothetical protein PMIN06_006465 [Paraphaeosphaeria minitans]